MDKKLLLDFLHKQEICVLSTVNKHDKPESAVVGFSENNDLELMVGTTSDSRKFKNLVSNPDVAIVIGWDEWITVQYEGTARVLEDEEELKRYQANHFAKLPGAEKYKNLPNEKYIVISPRWIRYTDLNSEPWLTKQLEF